MKIKTSELKDKALDYAAAKASGSTNMWHDTIDTFWVNLGGKDLALGNGWGESMTWAPSSRWSQGGPIIEREQISLTQFKGHPCRAHLGTVVQFEHAMFAPEGQPLVAAMRCFVAYKLGGEVEIPDELA